MDIQEKVTWSWKLLWLSKSAPSLHHHNWMFFSEQNILWGPIRKLNFFLFLSPGRLPLTHYILMSVICPTQFAILTIQTTLTKKGCRKLWCQGSFALLRYFVFICVLFSCSLSPMSEAKMSKEEIHLSPSGMSCLSKDVAHCHPSLVHFISQIPKAKIWAVGNLLNAKPRTEGACCSISFQKILRSNFWKNCQNKKKGNLVCGCSHIITSSKFGGFQTPPPPLSALVSICLTPPPPSSSFVSFYFNPLSHYECLGFT